jgi:M6 family metalloprotease-like protein
MLRSTASPLTVLFLLSLLLHHHPLLAQSTVCGTRPPETHLVHAPGALGDAFYKGIEPLGGAYLPFKGRVRGRVLFVQTRTDMLENEQWPNGQLPLWHETYTNRLHEYFQDMSGGDLDLTLDIFPNLMLTKGTEEGYVAWNLNFGFAIKEMIDSLDVLMSFEPYDLWDSEGNPFNVQESPDGKVDLLIVVFRSIALDQFLPFSGVSDLGFAGYHFVDNSLDRFFYGGSGNWNDAGASGLVLSFLPGRSAVMNSEYAFNVTIHELGHKLFGEAHPADLYSRLGIMAHSGNGHAMNSFERHLAGYIDYRELPPRRDTVITLHDYVSTDDAVLLPVPELARSYYAFEFRGKKSAWDTAPVEGLYIYRIYDSWSKSQKKVLVISAEGSYEWVLDESSSQIVPLRPSALTGYNRLQRIPVNNTIYWADGWWGDERVPYRDDRTELAVRKNPTPDFIFGSDTIHTNLHIRLLAMTDSTATVRISYQYPVILDDTPLASRLDALHLPYPHPISSGQGLGTIPYSIGRAGPVKLLLYDSLGRLLHVLADCQQDAGPHTATFSAGELSAGTYMIVLQTADVRLSRSLLITP